MMNRIFSNYFIRIFTESFRLYTKLTIVKYLMAKENRNLQKIETTVVKSDYKIIHNRL